MATAFDPLSSKELVPKSASVLWLILFQNRTKLKINYYIAIQSTSRESAKAKLETRARILPLVCSTEEVDGSKTGLLAEEVCERGVVSLGGDVVPIREEPDGALIGSVGL